MKYIEGLTKRVSNIITRYEYIDHMKSAAYTAFSVITLIFLVPLFIIVCMVVHYVSFCSTL